MIVIYIYTDMYTSLFGHVRSVFWRSNSPILGPLLPLVKHPLELPWPQNQQNHQRYGRGSSLFPVHRERFGTLDLWPTWASSKLSGLELAEGG